MWETPIQKSKSIYDTSKDTIQGKPSRKIFGKRTITYELSDINSLTVAELMEGTGRLFKTKNDGNVFGHISLIDLKNQSLNIENENDDTDIEFDFDEIEGILEEVK